MKKIIVLALVALLLAGLCACDSGEKITFKNDHINSVHSIYVSTVNTDEWGEPLNYAIVKKGSSISISFDKFAANGAVYDIAVLEDSDMLYEFYEVPLAVGDTLAFSGAGMFGTLIVTGTDGSEETFQGNGEKVETVQR